MHVDEHTFHLDESPVYYRSAEAPGMPKLYLHGIPTSSEDWLDFLARTGGIAPDLIGFGRSAKGGHLHYSLDGLVDFVEDLLSYLRLERVDVVGHDWGAAVAFAFAGRHPGQVRRLVLINPPPLADGYEWPRLIRLWRTRGVGELVMGVTTKTLLARTLRRGCVNRNAWSDGRINLVWGQFDQGTQRAILRLVRSAQDDVVGSSGPHGNGRPGPGPAPDAAPDAPQDAPRDTPATVIWGEADPWYPPALADAYAARLSGATVERIAGAGHWPWLDRPEVVDRVAALLEE